MGTVRTPVGMEFLFQRSGLAGPGDSADLETEMTIM